MKCQIKYCRVEATGLVTFMEDNSEYEICRLHVQSYVQKSWMKENNDN